MLHGTLTGTLPFASPTALVGAVDFLEVLEGVGGDDLSRRLLVLIYNKTLFTSGLEVVEYLVDETHDELLFVG